MSNNIVKLSNVNCFDIEQTLTCGQCFRFNKVNENEYYIIASSKKLYIKNIADTIEFYPTTESEYESIWKRYFDMETDYLNIQKNLCLDDEVMSKAVQYASGIHLLNQDPWECLISFIISQNNNIPRIKSIIEKISKRFGTEIEKDVFAFPSPDQLKNSDIASLYECGTGFRAKYISSAVNMVCNGELDLVEIGNLPTSELSKILMKMYGVGQKVSDCIMLFAYGRRETFPVDVWVRRVMEHFYFGGKQVQIKDIHELAKDKFASYGGYAQQYLFHYARTQNINKK